MKLIDADKLIEEIEEDMHDNPHKDPLYFNMHKKEYSHFLYTISKQSEIDPIHISGGCYCEECSYSKFIEYNETDDWVIPVDEYWCNKHKISMSLKGFCSEGSVK